MTHVYEPCPTKCKGALARPRAPLCFAGPHARLLSLGSELVYEKCATMGNVQSFDLLHVLTLCLDVHHPAQSDLR
jgi:hypothetical protein